MDIEHELRSALKRKSPSEGFAQRVEEKRSRLSEQKWAPVLHARRAVAAAALLTVILGGWTAREIVERRQGERARDKVLLALRITSEKLQEAQSHVVK